MGHGERQPTNPSRLAPTSHPAPPRTPTTPAARRPGTPRKAAQGTFCAACVCGSGNNARCQCKQDSRSQIYQGNEAKMARYSGGTYSKRDPRLKPMPTEEITYLPHKRHCKRSVTPPPRTASPITQEPSVKPVLLTPTPVYRESSTECQKVPPKHSPQSIASAQHGALSQERNSEASISHGRSSESRHNMDILEIGAPLILHTKLPKKHYQSEACWKGHFRVTGGLMHTCDGLEAHFPLQISVRVYEASKRMPEILNLEAVPVSQLWPKKFKMVPPSNEDIGLWFVSSHQRPHWSFDNLLEKVGSYGLFTKIGDTELAVFSSKLLTPQDQRKSGKLYFWGFFGKRIRKKPCQPNSNDSAKNSTSILEDSACQPACRSLVSPDLMLEIPPEFSPVPPGFSKAHRQLQTGTAALSYADVTPSLILDIPPGFPTDIPPGFTEAHRTPTDIPPGSTQAHRRLLPAISPAGPACISTPGTEKNPFVRFSLIPPGFTPLHAVKKEPGLPAVDETTDKRTLYSLASASAVVNPGKGDEPKIQDNEVKIEQDEISEEREFPKIKRLSDLYLRPSESTEISRPMSAHLPDKFQEQTPEKQMHLRTREGQESQEPSPAETAIRKSNVNGRIALNKGAGHGNGEARCVCASIGGRVAMPTKGPLAASPGDHLDTESISCRCVVCGEEFPDSDF